MTAQTNAVPAYFEPVEFKLEQAIGHLRKMGRIIAPPTLNSHQVALVSTGVTLHHEWRGPFNDEVTGFLSATRSVPELIQYRFGSDPYLKKWLPTLDQQEQDRRKDFQDQFETRLAPFRKSPLAEERNIALHRERVPRWEVRVKGRWGEYVGGPKTPLPSVEMPPPLTPEDPEFFGLADYPLPPIIPMHTDLWWAIPQSGGSVTRVELFPECERFLAAAVALVEYARVLVQIIHGSHPLTLPPP